MYESSHIITIDMSGLTPIDILIIALAKYAINYYGNIAIKIAHNEIAAKTTNVFIVKSTK